tara:strand:+ start:1361 stop:1633 length:273 start_codon:yes stop_codon:yes gene_type:complete
MSKWKSRTTELILIYVTASILFSIAIIYEHVNSKDKKQRLKDLFIPFLNFTGFLLILIYQYNIKWIEGFISILCLLIINTFILIQKLMRL